MHGNNACRFRVNQVRGSAVVSMTAEEPVLIAVFFFLPKLEHEGCVWAKCGMT